MAKTSEYKTALAALREKHADKIEDLFLQMYKYAIDKDEDGSTLGVEPKDSVNAAKVCVSLLGVPRPAADKEPVTKKGTVVTEKDTAPDPEEMAKIYDKLGL